MHARTGTLKVSPDRVEDLASVVRDAQIPRYREQDGRAAAAEASDADEPLTEVFAVLLDDLA